MQINELDGGRDKDRTCDPYDVNTALHLKPLSASDTDQIGKGSCSPDVPPNGGHILGAEKATIFDAAQWLHEHRSEVGSAIIPALRERFHLSALEAIEAAKLAREIEQGRQA